MFLFPSFWKLLISVLVLRSLLSSTKAPINYTRSKVAAETPTTNSLTSLDTAAKDVDRPSTWVDIRLVTRKGIQLVMLENGTVAGSWNQSLTEKLGRFGKVNSRGRVGGVFFFYLLGENDESSRLPQCGLDLFLDLTQNVGRIFWFFTAQQFVSLFFFPAIAN